MRVLYDPDPRPTNEILSPEDEARFRRDDELVEWQGENRDAFYREHLPTTEVLISQQAMDRGRLDLAPELKVIFNVETNLLPNIDYEECLRRGIHVLTPGAVRGVAPVSRRRAERETATRFRSMPAHKA